MYKAIAIYQTCYTLGNDVDFNSTMHTVTIAAGDNSTTVNITVIDDDIVEADEMFYITLSLPSSLNGAGVVLPSNNAIASAAGVIIDTNSELYCCIDISRYCIAGEFGKGKAWRIC